MTMTTVTENRYHQFTLTLWGHFGSHLLFQTFKIYQEKTKRTKERGTSTFPTTNQNRIQVAQQAAENTPKEYFQEVKQVTGFSCRVARS